MAVREFIDSTGRSWRVWEVTPDSLNARTKEEYYLAQLYYTGWLVFESANEEQKRRLYPVPRGWSELPDADLEVLLQKSEMVPLRKARADREATGEAAARSVERTAHIIEHAADSPEEAGLAAREETPDVTDLSVVRSFRYPGGRIWTCCIVQHPESGGPPALRFTAGAREIDLKEWPKDWADYPDEGLIGLLRRAAPRQPEQPGPGTPRRRYTDQPPEMPMSS